MRKPEEIYVVTDIEADGHIPGPSSMLSLGSVAVTGEGHKVGTYTFNLTPLPDAAPVPKVMAWWKAHPEAWAACNENQVAPEMALPEYATWLEGLPGKPVFVAWPSAYDYMFAAWYLHRFAARCPFGHSALDTKTLAMAYAGKGYLESGPLVAKVLGRKKNPHIALPDAELEAEMFLALLPLVRAGKRLAA